MADRPMASTSKAGCIPVASKAARPRAKSVYKAQVKGKGNSKKKLGKTAIVISSVSEASSGEVDFPNLPIPNQPLDLPAEEPEQTNNPNPLPENPPIPMANEHLNWSHFKPFLFRKSQKKTQRQTF